MNKITFKSVVHNDAAVYLGSRFFPAVTFVFFSLLFVTGDNLTIDEATLVFTTWLTVSLPFCLLAYAGYYLKAKTFSHGIRYTGVITKTNVQNKADAIQFPFDIYYKYKMDGKEVESFENFRSKSKARDIAIVGKEITVMRSNFGGFSFIRNVYEGDAEQVES